MRGYLRAKVESRANYGRPSVAIAVNDYPLAAYAREAHERSRERARGCSIDVDARSIEAST